MPHASLLVLAAASLSGALPPIGALWSARSGTAVIFNFDATSRLAKQAEAGAPGDVFIAADEEWIDYLAKKGAVSGRTIVARNALVAIEPKDSKLKTLSGARRLALAGENVPAGKYARAALERLKLWPEVEKRVVRGDNVRTALRWTASGKVDAGIVYRTDALSEPRVRIFFNFPEDSHEPIVYPAAVLKQSQDPAAAADFVRFCLTKEGRGLLAKAGFKAD